MGIPQCDLRFDETDLDLFLPQAVLVGGGKGPPMATEAWDRSIAQRSGPSSRGTG